jgi:Xaa-Pro aminopeptidase
VEFNKIFNLIDVDALLLSNLSNVRYFTNFTGSAGFVIISKKKNYFITDNRYKIQCSKEIPKNFNIKIFNERIVENIIKILKQNKFKSIGLEYDNAKYSFINKIKRNLKGVSFKNISEKILIIRSVKSEEEINKIKTALRIAEKSFNDILEIIKPGVKEIEIAIELEYRMRKNGSDGIAFPTIVASGKNSALPHAKPLNKKIKNNTVLLIDFGATYKGYNSDITKTVFIGNPQKILKFAYKTVIETINIVIENIERNPYSDFISKLADDYIRKKGFKDGLIHSLGHGVGLDIHEFPVISKRKKIKLIDGNIFTIEPGIYIENLGGVRVEYMLQIKNGKPLLLTPTKSYKS